MSSLKYWVWLSSLRGIGRKTVERLLEELETPEKIFFARENDYKDLGFLSDGEIRALSDKTLGRTREIMEQCAERGYRILALHDAEYPERLRNIFDPPVVLYVAGALPAMDDEAAVAFVGTRKCTPYGIKAAERISYEFSRAGGLVVSGLARGIDSAAARGALRAGGKVIGVLGCGLNTVYPPENKNLFQDVIDTGAIVSEYPPDVGVDGRYFPIRNRILSGLSLGVTVIEAPRRSGALITAGLALEQGRDVFVIPGNIDAEACEGSNELMKEGATIVTSGWEIAEIYKAQYPHRLGAAEQKSAVPLDKKELEKLVDRELGNDKKAAVPAKKVIDKIKSEEYIDLVTKEEDLTDEEKAVLSAVGGEEVQVDDIIDRTGLPAGKVLAALTMLEIKGKILRKDGKRFQLTFA